MKIASWNVNSLRVRLPHVLAWLEAQRPDVLALQEIKLTDNDFPAREFEQAGYQALWAGQPTYNGVAILAREPLEDPVMALPGFQDPQRRVLAATVGGVRVVDLYVPNGQSPESDKYRYKLDWLAQLDLWVEELSREFPRLVLLGDFNIAPEDRDVHDPKAWEGQVLVSPAERQAFQKLLHHGLKDSFRLLHEGGGHYSWWDYRSSGFRRNQGLRIDHILLSPTLAERCAAAYIDPEPRTWERPSDHAPVVTELTLP